MPVIHALVSPFVRARTACLAPLAGLALDASPASAQTWTATVLQPASATDSQAYGAWGNQQVGYSTLDNSHASLWSGSAGSWIDLNPSGASSSFAFGVDNGKQFGTAQIGDWPVASMWSGSAASWVNLNPSFALGSLAMGAGSGQQAGFLYPDESTYHACMWTGTAASAVDLHPAGADVSTASGTHNGQQVGGAYFTSEFHAGLWSGTAASWVDLHPTGAVESLANAVHNGTQVGYASIGVPDPHAGLWKGTSASWVDLHPPAASLSMAYGVFNDLQVGWAMVGDMPHASLWKGTSTSWVDLHAFLPSDFENSEARAVWTDGTTIYVAGSGFNTANSRTEALLWTSSASCQADCDGSGTLTIDDFICFQTLFALGDPAADCDASGGLSIDDFICFQTFFALGC